MHTKTLLLYFSPTGGTKKVGETFCQEISDNMAIVDLCRQNKVPTIPADALTVIATPVFGGRIPAIVTECLAKLDGTGRKTVTLVVYGNRAYEDALLELNDITKKCGFEIIASGAFVAQHSMNQDIAAGRPDDKDKKELMEFAEKVILKLNSDTKNKIKVPGNYPYKVYTPLSTTPISLSACTLCQQCVSACPTHAITMENETIITDSEKCILCMACTANCPGNARISWSINTLDETFWKDMDNAIPIERRLAAMKAFYLAGVRTTCFISPIFPSITDVKTIIRQAGQQCNLIWLENLNLRGGYFRRSRRSCPALLSN